MDNSLSKINRPGAALNLLAAGALLLSACSSENETPSYVGATTVDCGGKKELKASGSTAQANAMTWYINAYEKSCRGRR